MDTTVKRSTLHRLLQNYNDKREREREGGGRG